MGTNYRVEIILKQGHRKGDIECGLIHGLKSSWEDYPAGTRLLDLGSLTTEWSTSYPAVKLDSPVTHFYAGLGEGQRFDTFDEALLCSLYDEFQVNDNLKDGDTLTAEFDGRTLHFSCIGVHVVLDRATVEPPPGSWASVARMMAQGDDSGFDWDAWKDEMKERDL